MHYIFVSDIFGNSPVLQSLAQTVCGPLIDPKKITVLDPYDNVLHDFKDESQAYPAFLEACGHEHYAEKVKSLLTTLEGPVTLIGFSSGASAVWHAASDHPQPDQLRLWCFYPSQIHKQLDAIPTSETRVILASHEDHYSVTEVDRQLSTFASADCQISLYSHGFMNRGCPGSSEQGYQEYLPRLQQWLAANTQDQIRTT